MPEVRANRILIVDDVVAKDKFRSKVIKEMAPKGLIIHVYGIDRAVEKLKEPPSFDGERVIVIAETPLVFEELLKRGIRIPQLNIGGMGIRGERKTVARRIACDDREMESIHQIIRREFTCISRQFQEKTGKKLKNICQNKYKYKRMQSHLQKFYKKGVAFFLRSVILKNIELALDMSEC